MDIEGPKTSAKKGASTRIERSLQNVPAVRRSYENAPIKFPGFEWLEGEALTAFSASKQRVFEEAGKGIDSHSRFDAHATSDPSLRRLLHDYKRARDLLIIDGMKRISEKGGGIETEYALLRSLNERFVIEEDAEARRNGLPYVSHKRGGAVSKLAEVLMRASFEAFSETKKKVREEIVAQAASRVFREERIFPAKETPATSSVPFEGLPHDIASEYVVAREAYLAEYLHHGDSSEKGDRATLAHLRGAYEQSRSDVLKEILASEMPGISLEDLEAWRTTLAEDFMAQEYAALTTVETDAIANKTTKKNKEEKKKSRPLRWLLAGAAAFLANALHDTEPAPRHLETPPEAGDQDTEKRTHISQVTPSLEYVPLQVEATRDGAGQMFLDFFKHLKESRPELYYELAGTKRPGEIAQEYVRTNGFLRKDGEMVVSGVVHEGDVITLDGFGHVVFQTADGDTHTLTNDQGEPIPDAASTWITYR